MLLDWTTVSFSDPPFGWQNVSANSVAMLRKLQFRASSSAIENGTRQVYVV